MRTTFNRIIDFILRRRSPALTMMKTGAGLLAVMAGVSFVFSYTSADLTFKLDTSDGTPSIFVALGWILGVTLTAGGAIWEFFRHQEEQRRLSKKLVIAVEGRGLRDAQGQSLADSTPSRLEGRRQSLLLDIRQGIQDGVLVDPAAALQRLNSISTQLEQLTSGADRSDVSIVYGGMSPVPFTFLTGVMLDDEDALTVLDWDRDAGRWRELDAADDGKRFTVGEMPERGATEVVVAVSTSYSIVDANLELTFPNVPVVHLDLEGSNVNSHWSQAKQTALQSQFLDVMIKLEGRGVKQVHLVLSAQSSVAFNFGRAYDKRNLPRLNVYQFEREQMPPYPWSVAMPVAGRLAAEVVITPHPPAQ